MSEPDKLSRGDFLPRTPLGPRRSILSSHNVPACQGSGMVSVQLSGRRPNASIKRCQPEATDSAAPRNPNLRLVIMGDDIGLSNINAYSHGLMGYQTPNIDLLAEARFLQPG